MGGSWQHIQMYVSHATIGLNINTRWWLGSHHLRWWRGFGTLLCVGYQLYTSQFSEATTYIIGQVPGARTLWAILAPPMPSREHIR